MKYLKYCDFFDTKFHFYVGGHPTNVSIFGGIMSLIFCVSSIIIIFILSWSDFNKLNPITSKSEIPGGETRVVNLHNSKVWIPWRMVTYEEKFIDHRGILHPIVSFIEGKWNSSFGMDLTYHTINYKLCSETAMANKTKEYKIDIPLNEIFCLDFDDFPWGGSWHGDILYYFEVNLYLCEGGIDFNSSDPRCTKMSELLQHRNTSWLFEFYYPVVQFEPTNKENPMSVIYRSYFYRLSTYANKVERIYIQENIMEDDQSLLSSSPTMNSYWGITNIYGDSYFMPEEKDPLVKSVSSRIYSLVVYMDQGYVYYTRRYKNVFYIFSEILPLINVLLIILKKFTRYIKLTIARKNISEFIFENIHISNNEKSILGSNFYNLHKKALYEMKPKTKIRPSKYFLSLKKNIPENNHSSIVNLNTESLKNYNNNSPKEKEKNNRLKLGLNRNGNDSLESNLGDVNIIKFLNTSQLKRKTVNEPNRINYSIANLNNNNSNNNNINIYKKTNEGNKSDSKGELFPIAYYYMNLLFDRLIKPKSFFCFDKKYFTMYNFMVKIFDISSHIKLLKYFIIFIDFFFSNEYNTKKKNTPNFNKKININDESKMEEIETINDKNGEIFGKSLFI
jgi:hypothetical protein